MAWIPPSSPMMPPPEPLDDNEPMTIPFGSTAPRRPPSMMDSAGIDPNVREHVQTVFDDIRDNPLEWESVQHGRWKFQLNGHYPRTDERWRNDPRHSKPEFRITVRWFSGDMASSQQRGHYPLTKAERRAFRMLALGHVRFTRNLAATAFVEHIAPGRMPLFGVRPIPPTGGPNTMPPAAPVAAIEPAEEKREEIRKRFFSIDDDGER